MSKDREQQLIAALNDAREVFSIIYNQLSDPDSCLDGVQRSIDASVEAAQAFQRVEAVLGGEESQSVFTDVQRLHQENAELRARLAEKGAA